MNTNIKRALLAALACGALMAASHIQAQTTIADWTFSNYPAASGTEVASPAPSTGAGTATPLGMANTYGTPGPSMALTDVLLSSTDSSSGALQNEWRVRGTEITGGSTAANGWSSLAPIGTQGAEFQVSTAGYNNIQLSFDLETTTQGEKNLAVFYTLDGATWTPATITSAGTTSGASLVNNSSGNDANSVASTYVALSTTAGFNNDISVNFSGISGANNDANFGVEIVNASTGADCVNLAGAALNNSSGNWRYDNIDIAGTPTAVPEPADLPLVGLGLAVLTGLRRKLTRQY
jgi:hypothetical protein